MGELAPAALGVTTGAPVTCDWCLLCEDVTRDAKRRLTLHNVFRTATAEGVPAAFGKFYFVAQLSGVPMSKINASIAVLADRENRPWAAVDEESYEIEISGGALIAVPFERLPFPQPGPHHFVLLVDRRPVAQTTLIVWPPEPDAISSRVSG
jgi:hypothetical protein